MKQRTPDCYRCSLKQHDRLIIIEFKISKWSQMVAKSVSTYRPLHVLVLSIWSVDIPSRDAKIHPIPTRTVFSSQLDESFCQKRPLFRPISFSEGLSGGTGVAGWPWRARSLVGYRWLFGCWSLVFGIFWLNFIQLWIIRTIIVLYSIYSYDITIVLLCIYIW